MLLQFRKFSRGVIATGILILIGIAMVLFLPNGQFTLSGSRDLAHVGSYTVTPRELTREMQLTLRAQRAQGANISQQEAIDAGLHNRLLEGMIGRFSFYAYADRLGVSGSDRQVAERIRQIPNVLNPLTGQFDRVAYAAFLRELGYSQSEFERDVRGDMTNQMLLESLVSGVRPPRSYGALALIFESETRVVSIAEAPLSAVGAIAPPTEEQLQAFYTENRQAMQLPEYRGITVVLARPEDFMARVQVPAERIEEELTRARSAQATPERRTFIRVVAQSQAQADDLVARIGRGETPAAAAAALRLQLTRSENQTREQVTDARVAEAVFSMAAGAPARVVRGQLSPFVVVRVESIAAAPVVDEATLREQVRTELAAEEAESLRNAALEAFEDARGAGTAPAEAARAQGLPVLVVPGIDQRGRDQEGRPMPQLGPFEAQVQAAFELAEGESTDIMEVEGMEGAYVIVHVDSIIPAATRPFADVREELAAAWTSRERIRRLRELGQEVVAAVRDGQSFANATRTRRMTITERSRPLTREAAGQIRARTLAQQIFQADRGVVVTDLRADGQALMVAVVEDIRRVDPSQMPQQLEESRAGVEGALTQSLAQAVQSDVREQMRARRNERAVEAAFRPTPSGAPEEQ